MVKVPAIFNPDAHLYFEWTPYDFSTFIIYILFGLVTLWGGVWWIKVHYMPAAKAAGVPVHLATVWIVLLLTILFYILNACSAASVHLWALPRSEPWGPFIPRLWQTQLASMAFQNISATSWMLTLLVHARIVGRKLAPV
ncbi:hypothetical protein DL96DRAFT_1614539 [Flagelloscypha sp. PMI_526]|nr:hypothetical protein DL96DRAFT_1614539 [Flagelloscypha sp. PMI_526]